MVRARKCVCVHVCVCVGVGVLVRLCTCMRMHARARVCVCGRLLCLLMPTYHTQQVRNLPAVLHHVNIVHVNRFADDESDLLVVFEVANYMEI